MTTLTLPNRSEAISTRAARLAIAAIITYQLVLIALIFLRPDLDPSWHTISEWAIGSYGWGHVRCVSHFGAQLCGPVRDAQVAGAWDHGPYGARHPPDLRDWRDWGGNIHDRSNADALPALHPRHTSRDLRHQSVGALSICSAVYQSQPGSQQRSMEVGAASSTLDRWATVVWLNKLCGLLGYFCVSFRTGCLWSRRQHRLASAIRISHVHAVGRNLRLASDQVQP